MGATVHSTWQDDTAALKARFSAETSLSSFEDDLLAAERLNIAHFDELLPFFFLIYSLLTIF